MLHWCKNFYQYIKERFHRTHGIHIGVFTTLLVAIKSFFSAGVVAHRIAVHMVLLQWLFVKFGIASVLSISLLGWWKDIVVANGCIDNSTAYASCLADGYSEKLCAIRTSDNRSLTRQCLDWIWQWSTTYANFSTVWTLTRTTIQQLWFTSEEAALLQNKQAFYLVVDAQWTKNTVYLDNFDIKKNDISQYKSMALQNAADARNPWLFGFSLSENIDKRLNTYVSDALDAYSIKAILAQTDHLIQYNDNLQANYYYIEVWDNDLVNVLRDLLSIPNARILPLSDLESFVFPDDTYLSQMWHLYWYPWVNAIQAWDQMPDNIDPVGVAVIDAWIDYLHPDLAPHFKNTVSSATHGTHVAWIVWSVTNSTFGVASVAFNTVELYGYTFTNWIGALNDAVSRWVKVVNLSFWCIPAWLTQQRSWDAYEDACYRPEEQAAITAAYNAWVTIVAAAWNGAMNSSAVQWSDYVRLPAHYDHVIAVGNSTPQWKKAISSDYGLWLDIMAPGTNIMSTLPNNTYGSMGWTSMSSPLVASIASLLIASAEAEWISTSPATIQNILKTTAHAMPSDSLYANGNLWPWLVDACEAMKKILNTDYECTGADFFNWSTPSAAGVWVCKVQTTWSSWYTIRQLNTVSASQLTESQKITMAWSCTNGVKDGDETDIDCWWSSCVGCSFWQVCDAHSDCETWYCRDYEEWWWPWEPGDTVTTRFDVVISPNTIYQNAPADISIKAITAGNTVNTTATNAYDVELEWIENIQGQVSMPSPGQFSTNDQWIKYYQPWLIIPTPGSYRIIVSDLANPNIRWSALVTVLSTWWWNPWGPWGPWGPDQCDNGVRDWNETDIDCGGGTCPACTSNDACNINSDCTTGFCDTWGTSVEVCNDGIDNDGDGQVDCADSDCANDSFCQWWNNPTEICDDGIDNDSDGQVDCADSDCATDSVCQWGNPVEICNDGIDNDGDFYFDCFDMDCDSDPLCNGCNTDSDCDSWYMCNTQWTTSNLSISSVDQSVISLQEIESFSVDTMTSYQSLSEDEKLLYAPWKYYVRIEYWNSIQERFTDSVFLQAYDASVVTPQEYTTSMEMNSFNQSSLAVQEWFSQVQNTLTQLLSNTTALDSITPVFNTNSALTEAGIVDDPLIHNVYIFEFNENDPSFDVQQIEADLLDISWNGATAYIERVPLHYINQQVNDPQASNMWYLDKTDTWEAWETNIEWNFGVVVWVVDSWFEVSHPDLAWNIGYANPKRSCTHGTHTAGSVSAVTNNNQWVAAISRNIELNVHGRDPTSQCAAYWYTPCQCWSTGPAVAEAVNQWADIISMSFGWWPYRTAEQSFYNTHSNNWVIFIAAAWNDSTSSTQYPAGYDNVFSVWASNSSDSRAYFSNYWSWVDIWAPW